MLTVSNKFWTSTFVATKAETTNGELTTKSANAVLELILDDWVRLRNSFESRKLRNPTLRPEKQSILHISGSKEYVGETFTTITLLLPHYHQSISNQTCLYSDTINTENSQQYMLLKTTLAKICISSMISSQGR